MESDPYMNAGLIRDPDDLTYLVHHHFLPPKLPQEDDSSSAGTQALLQHVTDCAAAFAGSLRNQNVDLSVLHCWCTLHKMLKSMALLHRSEYIPLKGLCDSVNDMKIGGAFTPA
jgi:hypothetical protein